MNIQRKHCELVQAIHLCDNLTDVAKQLHLTPSALSHQLRDLESRIGATIVNRKDKPISLTTEGRRLLDSSRNILPYFDKLERELARIVNGDAGRLNLAIECHSCYLWLLPTLDQFRRQWPDVELDLFSDFDFDSLNSLVNKELDVVITADPEPINQIAYIPLFQYEAVLIMPVDHPLANEAVIEPAMLKTSTLIIYPVPQSKLDIFRYFLHPAHCEPAHLRPCEITVMMVALVASGQGLCTLPNWAAYEYTDREYVVSRSLGEEGVYNTLYAAVREDSLELPYMQDFLLLAKDLPFSTLKGIARPAE